MSQNSNGTSPGPRSSSFPPRVLAVGGGKGGIGKTFVSLALASSLAAFRKRVVLIDADFGGANLHTLMGIAIPGRTIHDFFSRKVKTLAETMLPTPIDRLQIICGAPGSIGVANLSYGDKQKFLRHIRRLDADMVVLDLGSGMSFNEIDLFNAADISIVVANPEPTSIQECYNFLKVALFRRLRRAFVESPEVLALLERRADDDHRQDNRLMVDLGREVYKIGKAEGDLFARVINGFSPKLILNRVFKLDETRDGLALQIAAGDLMRVHLEYWGYLTYDSTTPRALRAMNPRAIVPLDSENFQCVGEMVERFLLNKNAAANAKPPQFFACSGTDNSAPQGGLLRGGPGSICSVRCPLWGDCTYQNGGLPCGMPEEEYQKRTGPQVSVS